MLRHPRVKRPDLFQAEEGGERLGGHAAAPKGAVDPIPAITSVGFKASPGARPAAGSTRNAADEDGEAGLSKSRPTNF